MTCNDVGEQPPDVLALVAVVLTIAVHLGIKFVSDKPSVPFIAGASLLWALFVSVRAWRDMNAFQHWGFRRQNLLPAAAASAWIFCVGAVAMAMIATYQRHL